MLGSNDENARTWCAKACQNLMARIEIFWMKLKEMKVEEIKRNQHLLKRKIKEKVKDKICYKTTEVKSKTLDWGLVLSLAIYKGGQNGHVRNS